MNEVEKVRLLAKLIVQQKGRCAGAGRRGGPGFCRTKLNLGAVELDHITPRYSGGRDHHRNFQALCQPCNREKSKMDPIEYYQSRGNLL